MAKISKRTQTTYTIEHEGKTFEVQWAPVDYREPAVKAAPGGRTVIGYLSFDPEPLNPYDANAHLGTMICWHSRYRLGEANHRYGNSDELWSHLLGTAYTAIADQSDGELADWYDAHGGTIVKKDWDVSAQRRREAIRAKLTEQGYTVLPLYLYDHGGITISCGGFSCPWDSGQIGFIYAGPEDLKRCGVAPASVVDVLQGEVAEYAKYLEGDCYGVCVEVFDAAGQPVSDATCWGFLGLAYAEESLQSEVAATVKSLLRPVQPKPLRVRRRIIVGGFGDGKE